MTKMAAMPIFGQNLLKIFFFRTFVEILYVALGTLALQMFFKDDLVLTLYGKVNCHYTTCITVELQWFEHLWDHAN